MTIGVLALQGAFLEHEQRLDAIQVKHVEIRKKSDLNNDLSGLIIPGGESTVIGKLLHELDLFYDIRQMIEKGMPTFGTCAGMILLAKKIGKDDRIHLGLMDIQVKRNAYGRQLGSFFTEDEFKGIGKVPMTFIRAPFIELAGKNVEALSVVDNKIVAAKEKNILVTSFHPELTPDTQIHQYFIDKIVKKE